MKENKIEYYPNGRIKHKIAFHDNGRKYHESFRDENGNIHRINKPAYQSWYDNGIKGYDAYYINGRFHNIGNPSRIWYFQNAKICWKNYYINENCDNKLTWMNIIKNI